MYFMDVLDANDIEGLNDNVEEMTVQTTRLALALYRWKLQVPAEIAKASKKHQPDLQKISNMIICLSDAFKYGVLDGIKEAMSARFVLRRVRDQLEDSLTDTQGLRSMEDAQHLIESLNELVKPSAVRAEGLSEYFENLSQAFTQTQSSAQQKQRGFESSKKDEERRRLVSGLVASAAAIVGLAATFASGGILLPFLATIGATMSGAGAFVAMDAHQDIASAKSAAALMTDISDSIIKAAKQYEMHHDFWDNLQFDMEHLVIDPQGLIKGGNLNRALVEQHIRLLDSAIAQYEDYAQAGRRTKSILSIL